MLPVRSYMTPFHAQTLSVAISDVSVQGDGDQEHGTWKAAARTTAREGRPSAAEDAHQERPEAAPVSADPACDGNPTDYS